MRLGANLQLPMTTVLTTRDRTAYWLAAVLFISRAVVYLSQRDMSAALTAPRPATTAATVFFSCIFAVLR